jgi:hypothetical protein
MLWRKGLVKSIKHRLFEQFSDAPVIFAVLALGALNGTGELPGAGVPEGKTGFVRTPQTEVKNEELLPSFQYLGVDRALLLREECTTGICLQKDSRLKCNAKQLGLHNFFDNSTGVHSNMCEVQVSRFRDSLELVRGYEYEHQVKFDWVTRPRPDIYFLRPAPSALTLTSDNVYVSPWAACGYGGMDWFYAVPRQYADTVADFTSSVSCSDYHSNPDISHKCSACLGCECWLAAWMYAKKVPFRELPWAWFTPSKFCNHLTDCPDDWNVTQTSVMGLDSQVAEEPCTQKGTQLSCPSLKDE